jgi:hypothetical protein
MDCKNVKSQSIFTVFDKARGTVAFRFGEKIIGKSEN